MNAQIDLIAGTSSPTSPPLRYFGGKWLIAPAIIKHFPPHTLYAEPFSGGFSVGFRKLPAACEIYNDIHGPVVGFFKMLRDHPQPLIEAIKRTPRSKAEFLRCQERPSADSIEQSRRFYVCSALSYIGTGARYIGGTSSARIALRSTFNIEALWTASDRLQRVDIQQRSALEVVAEYGQQPQALLYVDPPYLFKTRRSKDKRHRAGAPRRQYACDFGSEEQHTELLEALLQCRAKVILSGYQSELYAAMLRGWRSDSCAARTSAGDASTEFLWMNF